MALLQGAIGTEVEAGHLAPYGEASARADLRRQIARLDHELCELRAEAHPHRLTIDAVKGGPARLQSVGQLESARDRLAASLESARSELTQLRLRQQEARGLVERMLADPAAYKWHRVSRDDAGLVGCGHWHVLPKFGPIGMALGWWRVKISSGCPLAGSIGLRPDGAGV